MADISDQTPWDTAFPDPKTKRAKRVARQHNRDEFEIIMTVEGNPFYNAAMVGTADASFGRWAGNYLITKCIHNWTPSEGYTTRLQMRKVLKGY